MTLDIPSLEAAKRLPITEVAARLDLEVVGRMIRCWRPESHQSDDRTPSVGINYRRNRVRCFVCDPRSLSPIDLVMSVRDCDTYEAILWLDREFHLPRVPRGKHLGTRTRHVRVGASGFPLEYIVRSGFFADLPAAAIRVLLTLMVFADHDLACLSYGALRRYSGVCKNATVARAIQRLASLHMIEVIPGPRGVKGLPGPNSYRLTPEDCRLLVMLADCQAKTRQEVEAERRLRAERRQRITEELRREPEANC